jgi:hypothetical protein
MSRFGLRASDEVTVTNRSGRRAGLRIAQPSGDFAVRPTSVFPMR